MDLKSERLKKDLTQEQLAEETGLPQTTISDIETGRIKKPSWDTVARISKALGIDPQELFPVDEPKAASR